MIKPKMNTMFPRQETRLKMEDRTRSADEYHTARWTRESREYKRINPICRRCESFGKIRATEATDHIIPFPVCADFWDQSNWQPLCRLCNIEKGIMDKPLIQKYKHEHQ